MATWVTGEDVTNRWVGDGAPEPTNPVLLTKIDDAEEIIGVELPDVGERVEAGTLTVARLRMVVASMVERAFRNPRKMRTDGESTGATSVQLTYSEDKPGALWLTDEERLILGFGPLVKRGAFTIDPTPAAAADFTLASACLDWS